MSNAAAAPCARRARRLRLATWIPLVALAGLTLAWVTQLWPQWRNNPDLSHGLFMPVVFVLLIHEARTGGVRRYLPPGPGLVAGVAALAAGALLLFAVGALYAVALEWSHALVQCVVTGALVLGWSAALLAGADQRVQLVPFNWSALVAIGLWQLSAPLPPGSYARLTLGLQLWVTENVLDALHLLGIPAHRSGNIIELAATSVGVEEACSGVRSLLSCVFAGLFFSATLLHRPWARGVLIVLAALLALGMNFLRSLGLTLLANAGVDIGGAWHDVTGYAILGLTALAVAGLAVMLGRIRGRPDVAGKHQAPAPQLAKTSPPQATAPLRLLAGAGVVACLLVALFATRTRPASVLDEPVPDLAALLPAAPAGWRSITDDKLYRFAATLQTDHLVQRTYARRTPIGVSQITIYLAYWRPGQAPVSLVASHTPDACWPGSGWTLASSAEGRRAVTVGTRTLSEAEYRLFKNDDFPQHVWFWHLYAGQPIAQVDPFSPSALLQLIVRYGVRSQGSQLFVRVSSNQPWETFSDEAFIRELFDRLRPLGL
ncbi:MAG TPA: exosortase/archaeosortase family protein [Opitutaceae bacterium]